MNRLGQDSYQRNYSELTPIILDARYKGPKIGKMLAVLRAAGVLAADAKCDMAADVGSSSGLFAQALGVEFKQVLAFDIDVAALHAGRANARTNVHCVAADSQQLPIQDGSLDLVVCNHVYEHVPDANRLFDEIHRVLRVGGICYFGAASRLTVIEPHYRLPFLSWLPKGLADRYMQWAGRGPRYYENLRSWRGIKRLMAGFSHADYTIAVLRDPDRFDARDMIAPGSWIERVPVWIWKLVYVLLPTYILVLTKNQPRATDLRNDIR